MPKRVTIAIFLAFFSGALALVSCGKPQAAKKSDVENRKTAKRSQAKFVKPAPVSHDYVGSEACRSCHADIMKEYASHPMSVSMSVASKFDIEDFPIDSLVESDKGASWSATRKNGVLAHVERVKSASGKELFVHKETIDFTCGSGTNGCSYFVFDDGQMFQSPLTWYSESREWDLSPGYAKNNHLRFERMAGEGCLTCHAGRMNPDENQRGAYKSNQPFHELAIGCERCHGPGKAHIDFHESSKAGGQARDPIVNPEKLSPAQREAVCYQCHLSGVRRVTRYGRTDFDFRPGMHLSDIWITFLKPVENEGGKLKAVSHFEQMRNSECFVQSKGEFGCISCHDPHRSPAPDQRIGFYRDKCSACHQANSSQSECSKPLEERRKESPEDSCIQCHMPKLSADEIAHLALTDHRVHIPGDKFRATADSPNDTIAWNDKDVAEHSMSRAKTIAMAASAFTARNRGLAVKALNESQTLPVPAKDDLPLREALAQLCLVAGNTSDAFRIWNELLEQYPRDQFLLDQVSRAYHEADKIEEAYPLYKRLFEINSRRPSVLLRYLEVCRKLSKTDEGILVAQRILELEPGIKSVHQWLARAYQTKGENVKSEHHRKLAEQLPTR